MLLINFYLLVYFNSVTILLYSSVVVQLFPPLYEVGFNILNNFASWGDLRKENILDDVSISNKVEELQKVDERVEAFRQKMAYLGDLKAKVLGSPARPRAESALETRPHSPSIFK